MCGVSFLWSDESTEASIQSRMELSLEKIAHRGPDFKRYELLGSGCIGHTRLSIIDIEASHQPMVSPNGRYHLAYNGEIYNYQQVRKSLEHSWQFKTKGDTEVLLAGLILFGVDFLNRLEGMWSFVFWDELEENLLLCRDRMGKKPLFYRSVSKGFSCCSELPGLAALSEGSWCEDLQSTADYFRYGFYLPGHTAYENVQEVKPGHVLRWKPKLEPMQEPYWTLGVQRYLHTKENAIDDLKNALHESVKRRLVSDVDVGCFLSGGVDSSILAALSSKYHTDQLKTFTIGFDSKSYDERKFARKVSEYLRTDHYEHVLEGWSREEMEVLLKEHVGQPFQDPSLLPTSKVSELASKHVKVALSGDGGDELFCGYQRYKARAIISYYRRLPQLVKEQVAKMIRLMPEPTSHHSGSLLKKAHLFLNIVDCQKSETPYVSSRYSSDVQFDQWLPGLSGYGYRDDRLIDDAKPNEVIAMMFNDAHIYLPQDIHTKVDRASMRHSLEARAPFMDKSIVELAFSLPVEWQCSWRTNKPMLYNAFSDMIPEAIWGRRKQGFSVPVGEWFKGEMGEDLLGLLDVVNSPFINKDAVKNLYKDNAEGRKDNGHKLWLFYVYLLWKESCPWLVSSQRKARQRLAVFYFVECLLVFVDDII